MSNSKNQQRKEQKAKPFDYKNLDLGSKDFKLSYSNFKICRGEEIMEENLEIQLNAFTNPV